MLNDNAAMRNLVNEYGELSISAKVVIDIHGKASDCLGAAPDWSLAPSVDPGGRALGPFE